MKVLHISDTHSKHQKLQGLPEADVLVHSGDFTVNGTEREAIDFINWFCGLPYEQKIFVSDNHDDCMFGANIEGLDSNVHYLCNSGIEINGVKFYGVPMFLYDSITDSQSWNYANVPSDTDVLITHSPPYGILDFDDGIHYGSHELLARVSTLKLKAHLFGHIHAQQGVAINNRTIFSNGSIIDYDENSIATQHVIIV